MTSDERARAGMNWTTNASLASVLLAMFCLQGAAAAQAPTPSSRIPSALQGQISIEHTNDDAEIRLHVNARMRGSAPHGLTTLPFAVRDGRIVLSGAVVLEPAVPNTEHEVNPILDTGAQGSLVISNERAALYHAWLSAEVGLKPTCTPFESYEYLSGALGGLRLGVISMEPVPVRAAAIAEPITIGMEAMAAFEGAIIDWDRRELHFVVRRTLYSAKSPPSRTAIDALAASDEWTVAGLQIDATTETLEEMRHVFVITRSMWPRITITVDSHEYVALIDTGYAGDVLLRRDVSWPLVSNVADEAAAHELLSEGRTERQHLHAPLMIGSSAFEDVEVETGWTPPEAMAGVAVDAVLGIGVLSRSPIWLDLEAKVLRVWTGADALPDLNRGDR